MLGEPVYSNEIYNYLLFLFGLNQAATINCARHCTKYFNLSETWWGNDNILIFAGEQSEAKNNDYPEVIVRKWKSHDLSASLYGFKTEQFSKLLYKN